MKRGSLSFKWRHHTPEIILLCVRRYCRYQLSYRDLEEMMRERGPSVDHVTIFRRVQAPSCAFTGLRSPAAAPLCNVHERPRGGASGAYSCQVRSPRSYGFG
jgi:hypothetical protein